MKKSYPHHHYNSLLEASPLTVVHATVVHAIRIVFLTFKNRAFATAEVVTRMNLQFNT
jgi:hypothetical protein